MTFRKKLFRKIGIIFNLSFISKYQKKWKINGGDQILRYNHDTVLNNNSVVFDLGGYEGEFSEEIYKRYKSKIYIFEISRKCIDIIENKFKDNDDIKIFNFGLGPKDEIFYLDGDGPGAKITDNINNSKVQIKSIFNFLNELNLNHIDLIKINIEGAEYDLLNYLCDTGLISNFKKIQVQFHDFDEDCLDKLLEINRKLTNTHKNILSYPFVWEEWIKKN